MITLEKNASGYVLGIFEHGIGWEYVPCDNLDAVEIEAHRRGLILKDDAKIWHNAYGCNDEQTNVRAETARHR